MKNVNKIPFLVILIGVFSLTMLLPSAHALYLGLHRVAQAFFYSSLLFSTLTILLGFSLRRPRSQSKSKNVLMSLVGFYVFVPLFLALPLKESLVGFNFISLYFEMVSCLTTTGATIFDSSYKISEPIHLWRSLVGWLGGFVFLIIVFAILTPMKLGGFEVFSNTSQGNYASRTITTQNSEERLLRYSKKLFPIYFIITVVLFFLLLLTGNRAFTSLCLAFSTLSTSGILPYNNINFLNISFLGQLIIFVFLILSFSHTFTSGKKFDFIQNLKLGREVRVAFIFTLLVMVFLLVSDTFIYLTQEKHFEVFWMLKRIWPRLFSTVSFIATSGFAITPLSGENPIIPFVILAGLSIIGGGVATTAGGIKLIRFYALFKHGANEINRLSHPRSVSGFGTVGRDIRQEGAFNSWILFMLFSLIGVFLVTVLAFLGISLETAVALSMAVLSTNGNLLFSAVDGFSYNDLLPSVKVCLIAGMIAGRFEVLAILVVLIPRLSLKD